MHTKKNTQIVTILLAVIIVTIIAGVGAYLYSTRSQSTNNSTGATGVLAGTTVVDGGCPLIMNGSPCPTQPIAATITFTGVDNSVTTTSSNQQGVFSATLKPGKYTVHAKNLTQPNLPPTAADTTIEILAGKNDDLTIQFDSGVR